MIQSCKYIQLLANNFQPHQPTPSTMKHSFEITSTKPLLRRLSHASTFKYLQTPFLVSSKPFIWVGLLFENYLILLKAPPPSTTSLEESSVKIRFLKLIPTPHSETMCVNESRGGICREGKFLTYHKLTRHTTKSTKYNQLQSATCCY